YDSHERDGAGRRPPPAAPAAPGARHVRPSSRRITMSVDDRSPQDRVFQTLADFWAAQAVHAAARLGLADHLAERPRSAAELAAAPRPHAPSLARLLRALAAAGWLRESAGRYGLTPFGEALRTGTPGSQRPLVLWALGGEHYRAWASLLHSIETGRTAF